MKMEEFVETKNVGGAGSAQVAEILQQGQPSVHQIADVEERLKRLRPEEVSAGLNRGVWSVDLIIDHTQYNGGGARTFFGALAKTVAAAEAEIDEEATVRKVTNAFPSDDNA